VLAVPERSLPEELRRPFDFRQQFVVDSSRIRRELGYREPIDEDDALRRTIEWELSELPAPSEADYAAEDIASRSVG
jgi:nucleoside-diphosphate-sugar epimerase